MLTSTVTVDRACAQFCATREGELASHLLTASTLLTSLMRAMISTDYMTIYELVICISHYRTHGTVQIISPLQMNLSIGRKVLFKARTRQLKLP